MTSGQQPEQPKRDPADFLADMAGGEDQEITPPEQTDDADDEPDPLAALDLMAGEAADEPAELEFVDEPAEPAGAEQAPADAFAAVGMDGRAAFRARQARAAAFAGRQASHHAHLYKKTMVVPLLIVGALLVLVGILAIAMLLASPDQRQTKFYGYMIWVAVVSFPLSGALFFGAWAFHRETRAR